MANAIKWSALGALTTYLSTELNSLANGANKLGAAINNDTDRNRYISLELHLAAQGSARSAGAYVALYILASLDGVVFTFGDDSTDPPASSLVGTFPLDAATAARDVVLTNISLPASDFKMLVINETGQAFAASANTLKYVTHNEEIQ